MRSFSKKLAFVLAAAMVVTAFAPAASAKAAEEMAINKQGKILYVTDGEGINDAAQVGGGKGNVASYDFAVSNKPANYKETHTFAWSSSDEDVITVGKAGLTTAVGVGEADVICVVTEKATGKATVLRNTVTVKANAADVALKDTSKDGTTVVAGDVINLDRVMTDAAGNETTKRGEYVTDYTRWIAEPATGVTINQKNGEFTFGEDAVAGDYTLYCETYQSSKYTGATATSEKIVVTFVKDVTFDVKQDTVKKFTVKFDAAVKSLGEVTVNRLFKGFELPALVKTATLAEDGMSATVEMYTALVHNNEYVINIAGCDPYTLTASAGDPVEVLIYVDEKEIGTDAELVYFGETPSTLKYRLIDANGVDVTDVAGGVVLFTSETYSTDGSYYVSADQMWFAKELVEVTVLADYQSGRYQDGVQLAPAKGVKTFISMKKEPVQVAGLADWKIAGDWNGPKKTVAFGETATLDVKIKLTEGDPVAPADLASKGLTGTIVFKELNPDVAALAGNQIVYFKQGVAKILVSYVYNDGTNDVELPIAQINAEATAPKALQSMSLDKTMVTLGTEDGYDSATVTVSIKDNYGGDWAGVVTIEGVDDKSKATLEEGVSYVIDGNKITLEGYQLQQLVEGTPATVQLTYKVKVDGKLEQNVTVLLKSRGAEGTEYLQIEADGFGVDVARTAKDDNTKAEKNASFTVFKYSNGIKVGTQELEAYDANNITANAYYFKVTKDGTDVTEFVNQTEIADGKVTINFSATKTDDNGYTVVDYGKFGAGNYVFTLYKGVAVADKAIAVQQNASAGVATCNVGAYSSATRVKDSLNGVVTEEEILKAFAIKDTQGNDVTTAATYSVDFEEVGNYVNVKSFTFYDAVADGVYVAYNVPVGISLMK